MLVIGAMLKLKGTVDIKRWQALAAGMIPRAMSESPLLGYPSGRREGVMLKQPMACRSSLTVSMVKIV